MILKIIKIRIVVGVNIMEEKTKIISFNELEIGEILSKDLEQNGRILLKKRYSND